MELSRRLQAVADLVSPERVVADIGTDHGYIPIYLIQSGKCSKAFAMDVNEGPLLRAKQHVASYNLSDFIEARLSNGMKELQVSEVNAIIIAGMGGALVVKILEQDRRLWNSIDELILQPQSELEKVRLYLQEEGLKVVEENMIYEDGKFYPMMKVIFEQDLPYSIAELRYGRLLIKNKNTVLREFIKREITQKEKVIESLSQKEGAHIRERILILESELEVAHEVYRDIQ